MPLATLDGIWAWSAAGFSAGHWPISMRSRFDLLHSTHTKDDKFNFTQHPFVRAAQEAASLCAQTAQNVYWNPLPDTIVDRGITGHPARILAPSAPRNPRHSQTGALCRDQGDIAFQADEL